LGQNVDMKIDGVIHKMRTALGSPVAYTLEFGDEAVDMNALIGQQIKLSFAGDIFCIACGKKTKKSFAQGFCYPCFMNAPEASECIIRPELCRAHEGEGRDIEWEKANHLQEHFVYLAVSSGLKVGVTRSTQIPTRWIDQGASRAILFAQVPNRYLAGCIEVALKEHVSDKTNWQKMLKNEVLDADLEEEKSRMEDLLPRDLQDYIADSDEITEIEYPVENYPLKIKSIGFDKEPEISGTLEGIKGQYLYLDFDRVLNIRKHTGYHITLDH